MSSAEIPSWIDDRVTTLYERMWTGYIVWTLACVLLAVLLPICYVWIVRGKEEKEGIKKVYVYRYASDLSKNYVILILFALFGIRSFYRYHLSANLLLKIVAYVLLAGIILSIKYVLQWKRFGILLLFFQLAIFTLAKNYEVISILLKDGRYQFLPTARLAVFFSHDYWVTAAMLTNMACAILFVTLTVFYDRRRFLFRDVGSIGTARCENCGNPMLTRDKYCICCGAKLDESVAGMTGIQRLELGNYCSQCGKALTKGVCADHNKRALIKTEKLAEWGKKLGLGITLSVIFIAALRIPEKDMACFFSGESPVRNEYIECFNAFYSGEEKVQDKAWLASFHASSDSLAELNRRWIYIDPENVNSTTIGFYGAYCDAAYSQLIVIERIRDSIDAWAYDGVEISAEAKDSLAEQFNTTVSKKAEALRYYKVNSDRNVPVQLLIFMITDFFHAYFHDVFPYAGLILLFVGMLVLLALLSPYFAFSIPKDLRYSLKISAIRADLCRNKTDKADSYDAYQRSRRKSAYIGISVFVGILLICFGINLFSPLSKQEKYDKLQYDVVLGHTQEITDTINHIKVTHSLSDDEKIALFSSIDAQIESDQAFLRLDSSSVPDEEVCDYYALSDLCRDEIEILSEIRGTIDFGMEPNHEQVYAYAALRGADYRFVLERIQRRATKDAIKSFF